MLILAESRETALQHLEVLVFLLEALGFIVNKEKSILCPIQELELVGLLIDSLGQLPSEKMKQIRKEAGQLQRRNLCQLDNSPSFLGS